MKKYEWLPPILGFLFLTLLLEGLTRTEIINPVLLPPPSQMASVLWEMSDEFGSAFKESFSAVAVGYFLSIVAGLALAILFSLNDFLKRSILPFAIFFQTVPIIAVAPLLVIYFGFGPPTVIAASFIVAIFPIIANTLVGLSSIDKNHLELFRIYQASSWKILTKLRIPAAYPATMAGIRISAGLAVIGAVAGEFVAGGGLGALIDSARTQQRIDIVFSAILLLSFLGLILILFINLLDRLIQKWRPLSPVLESDSP